MYYFYFIFYFIIYKIDKEYYEYKTTQNPRSMDLSHCSKKVNFDLYVGEYYLALMSLR